MGIGFKAVAVMLMLFVMAVLVAPVCNLQPTAMRALQIAAVILCGMGTLVAILNQQIFVVSGSGGSSRSFAVTMVQDIDCVRLC